MTTATEILKLIEAVDPADTAKLDEIDELMSKFLTRNPIMARTHSYTRSRDILKKTRPSDWVIKEVGHWDCTGEWYFLIYSLKERKQFYVENLPTEELAELHAIIQAIEYERQQVKNDQ